MKKVEYSNNPKNIKLQVVLGNPRIGCDGYGICKFVTKTDTVNFINPDRLIDVCLFIESGQLHFTFKKAKMTETTYEMHFSEGIFRVETDTLLPEEIVSVFKYPPSVLAQGIYKITTAGDDLSIKVGIYEIEKIMLKMDSISNTLYRNAL
jgi:hypothetical protein